MEHFKIINLLETMKLLNHINLGQKFGLKQMMLFMESITPIAKSNLTLQCWSQLFVITVMSTYLWKKKTATGPRPDSAASSYKINRWNKQYANR